MATLKDAEIEFTTEVIERVWHMLRPYQELHPISPFHAFSKTVHTGSTEDFQFEYTFMERLEQAKDEAVMVQDFQSAADIRDLMDKFKKAGK